VTPEADPVFLANYGFCPTCDAPSRFVSRHPYYRSHYRCERCHSVPRERALMLCLERFFPRFRELVVHESSPSPRGASVKLAAQCKRYVASQFFPDVPAGAEQDGIRCENLERLGFGDAEIDVHVTQDVMEHILDPDAAFREIARTLRPGGAHVFTVPLVRREKPSRARVQRRADGSLEHLLEPQYHGNPIDPNGSLVTMDWGYDICDRIFRTTGLATKIIEIDDIEHGIRGEFSDVLITFKPAG
jgi:SAM-dependent methyltransferase